MDKDQDLFIAHCKKHLGDYQRHKIEAKKLYKEAHDLEPVEHKKQNAGIIAGNRYLLSKLKEILEDNWRPEKKQDKKPVYTVNGAPVNSGVKPMKPIPKGMTGIKLD